MRTCAGAHKPQEILRRLTGAWKKGEVYGPTYQEVSELREAHGGREHSRNKRRHAQLAVCDVGFGYGFGQTTLRVLASRIARRLPVPPTTDAPDLNSNFVPITRKLVFSGVYSPSAAAHGRSELPDWGDCGW